MGVRVFCPGCHAGVTVNNARYLVVVRCYACGQEFLAQGHERPQKDHVPPVSRPLEVWTDEDDAEIWVESSDAGHDVLTFCPMCGDLASAADSACPSCGEPLPDDRPGTRPKSEHWIKQARRFRRQAQLLGVLWIFLAFLLAEHDFWLSETRMHLPGFLSGGRVIIPPIPLMATILVGVGTFALVGQFWAVAVGGLLNYLVLFVMVWRANAISLAMLSVVIILTHLALSQAASARFR